MPGTNELGLADLFEESKMKIQSSTIYRALRGDGMRVRPLARSRSAIGKSQTSPAKSGSRPGSYKPEKGRVAAIKDMFESKVTSKNDSSKTPLKEATCKTQQDKVQNQNRLNSPNKPSGMKKRELTPVSESSAQRVPFRSTKLERPVSRASLKEEESENKTKSLRRMIDTRVLQKKSVPLFEVLGKGKDSPANERNSNAAIPTRPGNKRRALKRKRLGVTRRATVVAGRPVIVREKPPAAPRKEEATKTEAGLNNNQIPAKVPVGAKLKTRPKPRLTPTQSMELARIPSMPKTPSLKKAKRNAIVREVVPKTKTSSPVQPTRKQLWLPTENRDSYNQFCPDTKAKRTTAPRRKRLQIKKKTLKEEETDVHERRGGTAHTLAKSKFDNTTEEESSETDEEEAHMIQKMQKRQELKRRSMEFFNQFRYGETLRRSMPRIQYTSEILAKSEAEVKRRMTEMEVRLRLSRLDESVSNISGLVPKWSSMLQATKDISKIESIQKTLINVEKILEGKVEKARNMLQQYLALINNDVHSPPTEEMENIEMHSELVQLDLDSLERIFESYERQLQQELEEPTSISL